MSVGLSGPSGSGKSTLAKAIAAQESWRFIPSPGGACFKELGLPFAGLSFDQRLRVQHLILRRMDEALAEARGGLFISDRTPLDLGAYMLAEWGQRCDAAQGDLMLGYISECYKVLNRHYSMVVLLSAGIPYVDDGSRPPPNKAGCELHDMLCSQLVQSSRAQPFPVRMLRTTLDLSVRAATVRHFWLLHLQRSAMMQEGQRIH